MASKTSVPVAMSALATVLMLLLVAVRPAEADILCDIGCFMKCTSSLETYATCVVGCILTSCKGHFSNPSGVPDPSIHCSLGCVTSTCMGPKHDARITEKRGCVTTCVGGCHDAYDKKN